MPVPFLDLQAGIAPLRRELDAAIAAVIDSGAFAGGRFVEKFEQDFAAYCGCSEAVGVGNGTDALWFTLLAAGIGPGDEVITVGNTFAATVEAILFTGAKPVLVDVLPDSLLIDPAHVAAALTPRTKALIPVHLFGRIAEMHALQALAERHSLFLLEDACQAHGARLEGRHAGTIGHAGAFSFYPGKNLGAFGEAGAIVTNDSALATRLRCLRDHGQSRKYHHSHLGWNGRMDGIQAAVLSVKLPHLDKANARRRQHALAYQKALAPLDNLSLPELGPLEANSLHLFPIRTKDRDDRLKRLAEMGVHCGIHYPIPLHLQPAFANTKLPPGSLPVTERSAAELLSLPMYPELNDARISEVAAALAAT